MLFNQKLNNINLQFYQFNILILWLNFLFIFDIWYSNIIGKYKKNNIILNIFILLHISMYINYFYIF